MGGSKDKKKEQDGSATKKWTKSSSKPANEDEKKATEHLRKAQMESKIRERVASEAKAFDIVARLIEPGITAEFLLQAFQFIDHSHYEDIVEERSISHLCGYPLCDNELCQVAKKKYHISTKSNTVYDITERKKFCSNRCYHASEHLRKQIPHTPVWTRRGVDMEPFDLLQHEVSSHLKGEEVIGSRSYGLKEEVLLMEKLDQMDDKTAQTSKAKSAEQSCKPLEESKHLSRDRESLTTTNLSGSASSVHSKRSEHVEKEGEKQEKQFSIEKCDDKRNISENIVENKVAIFQNGDVELESSLKNLTLQDSEDVNGLDSDDDCVENDVGKYDGVSKILVSDHLCEEYDVVLSKTVTKLSYPVVADSDDESVDVQDNKLNNVSVDKVTESHSVSKSQVSVVSETCTDVFRPVERDSKARDVYAVQDSNKPKENALKLKQPGESKTVHLMRLLDRRKNLLSKVADIQSDLTGISGKSESELNGSSCSYETGIKADRAKPSDSDKREGLDEGNKHYKDSLSTSRQREEIIRDSEATRHPRKEKSTLTHKQSSTKTASQAEVSPLGSVCKVISTWVSAETLDYLGLNSTQREDSTEDMGDSSGMFLKDPDMQSKYQDLCQHLACQERDFATLLGEEDVKGDGDRREGKKPLPHYQELKRETEENQLKVQQFFAGSLAIKSKPVKTWSEDDEDIRPIVLPDIDSHNQLLIRRRIVLERLDRTMPSLLPSLGLSVQDISAALRELVFTFSLTSHSIVLKPVEWTLAAIILLKMMEIRCVAVSLAFQSPAKAAAFNMVLSRLDHSSVSLRQLVQDMLTQCRQSTQRKVLDTLCKVIKD